MAALHSRGGVGAGAERAGRARAGAGEGSSLYEHDEDCPRWS